MVNKYVLGSPFETNSIVMNVSTNDFDINKDKFPFFSHIISDNKLVLSYTMDKEDIVYGLGETNRGINKRGFTYISFCSDDPYHTEEKCSLYGAHNFIIINGSVNVGVYVDCSEEIKFDIGDTYYDTLSITMPIDNSTLYFIENDTPKLITKEFRKLIGMSYIAPYWAFGYQQCRWSYMSSQEVLNVVNTHIENDIPLDAVYLDIDYMDSFKDFTINKDSFSDFDDMILDLKTKNIHVVPIIDAGIKIEEGYDVYEEGKAYNHFCKDANGNDFVTGVWPGRTHFPDFFKEDTRAWFGDKYSFLIDKGIDGFWNDMNEPAIFYSDEGLKEAFEYIEESKTKSLSVYEFFGLKDSILHLSNSWKDYERFYHIIDGKPVMHKRVHNLYGYNMTKAAAESFEKNYPDKRFLLFSRSSYIGMHRYGGIWTGDNQSWWSHILLCLKMMPSLNMCGFLYSGCDIGGFGANSTMDLVLRWIALGIFTPLMRNHSALGTRQQEVYQFNNTEAFKNIINLRYRLIPHLYSEYMKSVYNFDMYFKPLAFDYTDDIYAAHVEDQILLGDSLMIAPIYTQNAIGRYVYLPDDMLFVKYQAYGVFTYEVMRKGHHYIDVALEEVPMFIRRNSVLPLVKPATNTSKLDTSLLEIIGFMDKNSSITYELYEDDGVTKNYNFNNMCSITINVDSEGNITHSLSSNKIITLNIKTI